MSKESAQATSSGTLRMPLRPRSRDRSQAFILDVIPEQVWAVARLFKHECVLKSSAAEYL